MSKHKCNPFCGCTLLANLPRARAVQERRRSNAAGAHNHERPRSEQERRALKEQE